MSPFSKRCLLSLLLLLCVNIHATNHLRQENESRKLSTEDHEPLFNYPNTKWKKLASLGENSYPYRRFESPNPSERSVVLNMCDADSWEDRYLKEFFPSTKYDFITDYHEYIQNFISNEEEVRKKGPIPQVVIYSIGHAGQNSEFDIVNKSIQLFKPAVLVHLSDEYLGKSGLYTSEMSKGSSFYDKVPLVLRQYGTYIYRSYDHPRTNVIQIPLGYM